MDNNPRRYKIAFDDGSSTGMTVAEILELVNDGHSEDWTDYDESDWIEGLTNWVDAELHLPKGITMYWNDPDDGACSCNVIVMEDTIVEIKGFGDEPTLVRCSNGVHYANELTCPRKTK
jgi:hypothetical protein